MDSRCLVCGGAKKRKAYKYCSIKCSNKSKLGKKLVKTKQKTGWKITSEALNNIRQAAITRIKRLSYKQTKPRVYPKVSLICESCKNTFEVQPYLSSQKFCSQTCYFKSDHISEVRKGEKNWKYKKDRTTLKKENRRGDSLYHEWRKTVYKRDSYTCHFNNGDCKGRIEAHHIVPWKDDMILRYDIKNGITLCHRHHPRKRAEEKKLIPYFQDIIRKVLAN